jgi:hypothetical protein
MTNLEVLCEMLRQIRRPDAAQILEDRTHEEWMSMSDPEPPGVPGIVGGLCLGFLAGAAGRYRELARGA